MSILLQDVIPAGCYFILENIWVYYNGVVHWQNKTLLCVMFVALKSVFFFMFVV